MKENKKAISYECHCGWQSMNKPPKHECPDCGNMVWDSPMHVRERPDYKEEGLSEYMNGIFNGYIAGYNAANEWVSVNDRLPESDSEYNVCYKMANGRWSVFSTGYSLNFKRFDTGSCNITHWMPLPTQPTT